MEDREVRKLADIRARRRLKGKGWDEQLQFPFEWLLFLVVMASVVALISGIAVLVGDGNPWPLIGTIVIGGFLGWIIWRLDKRWERRKYAEFFQEEILNIKKGGGPK